MTLPTSWRLAAVLLLVLPSLALAQDVTLTDDEDDSPLPANLAALEEERSQACVEGHALLESVILRLEPLEERLDRLEALDQAIQLEDISRVEPLDLSDPVEEAVAEWFERDAALGEAYAEEEDEEILRTRRQARAEIFTEIEDAWEATGREIEAISSEDGVPEAIRRCEGSILVRGIVAELCDGSDTALCEVARGEGSTPRFRFVDDATQLWDIQGGRPWTVPSRLRVTPGGQLDGARTRASAQRGNANVVFSLETIVLERDRLSEEEDRAYNQRLDELDIPFGHPELNIAPVVGVEVDLPGPMDEETAWVLHLGEEPGSSEDVIHVFPASGESDASAIIPLTPHVLDGIMAGAPLRLTAIGAVTPEAGPLGGPALWWLEFPDFLREQAVSQLVSYWVGGGLSDDLLELVPPSS